MLLREDAKLFHLQKLCALGEVREDEKVGISRESNLQCAKLLGRRKLLQNRVAINHGKWRSGSPKTVAKRRRPCNGGNGGENPKAT